MYKIIVSNIGKVWHGTSLSEAIAEYADYVVASEMETGKCSGETVTLTQDGETLAERTSTYAIEELTAEELLEIEA